MLNFAIVNCKCWGSEEEDQEFYILLVDFGKKYTLRAVNQFERNVWVEMISYQIQAAAGIPKPRLELKEWAGQWKKRDCVDEETFLQTADSGDILLFTGVQVGATLQRRIFGTAFDHVGMVLKYETESDLYFIDATQEGVTVLPWNSLRQYKDYVYKRVCYRKLDIERD